MRVISPHKRYNLGLFPSEERILIDDHGAAHVVESKKGLNAQFEQSGLFPEETKIVLESFSFKGLAEGVNPMDTVGVYDTEAQAYANGWSNDLHEAVKEELRKQAKLHPNSLLCIEEVVSKVPWGTYDEMDEEEIIAYATTLQLDYHAIRQYESENRKRPDLIQAMFDLEEGKVAEVVVEA